MSVTFEDVKGEWISTRSGKRVEVVSMRGDSLGLKHESGRQSSKQLHYFIEEYQRPVGHVSRQKPTCSDCTVERGYRPILDFVGLCPRHANEWQPLDADAHTKIADRYAKESHRWEGTISDAMSAVSEAHRSLADALKSKATK